MRSMSVAIQENSLPALSRYGEAGRGLLHKLTKCGSGLRRRHFQIRLRKSSLCRSAAAAETFATKYCAEAPPESAAAGAAASASAKL